MHEFSLMTGVLDAVEISARENNASKITEVKLVIGAMSEVLEEAMDFAFEALSPGTLAEGARLTMTKVSPKSRCLACGEEFEHDRLHFACPRCDSLATQLIAGKEMYIESMEIET
ncbi:MAG: hydrogenase maturation nickel metallochaperone HypA [Coriobacteriales bacterium]|jgi:hydrogenase nickel incorporation protein HypA/HybF|nr:hydrogenase maturation nickel metallochaperone HypA [Coriobacteriales bacterium]